MDATQALDDFDEEDLGDLNNSGSKKTVAFLKVLSIGEFPETIFPVYEGENIIGRHDSCDITIPLQVISKKHACIDVHGKSHLICDYSSHNKTRRNQMFLKPQAFYELVNEIELMFADVKCQYLFVQAEDVAQKDDDSGSETASESMIPPSVEDVELEQDLKDKEEQEELGEKYLEEATQDYSYKNPDGNSPTVLCEETDDETEETDEETVLCEETDDEKETETGSAANEAVSSSLGTEQTVRCSPQSTQLAPTMDATIPCNILEPDIIPETPYPQTIDFEPPFKLKRSVDVKADASRRISAGNTLAYGLSTLESPNSTRESMDVSESGKTMEEAFSEGFAPEPKSKLHFEDVAGQETPNDNKNSDKRLQDSVPRQDEFLDDLLATQLYEPMEIPESPEFLQQDASDDEPDRGGKDETFEGEISDSKITDNKVFEATGKTSVDENNHGNSLEGPKSQVETAKVRIPGDDMMETQAYGLGSLPPQDECEEMATQAYGLTCDGNTEDELEATQAYGLTCDAESAETEDELAATQAYGAQDTIVVPKLSNVFKVPGAMNTQELNEDVFWNTRSRDESADENEKVANEEYDDEMDIQPTQKYFDNQVKESAETSESSDNLPSFSNFMDLKSDSGSDFMSTRTSLRKKMNTHIQSSTPIDVKKSSVVIEGQNAISTEKRCYVECPGDEASHDKVDDAQSSSTRKKPAREQKKSTARRGKEKEPIIKDQTKLSNTPGKVELAVSSTKGNNVITEDADNQHDAIVVKRGKGRSTRGATRSSSGKRDDLVGRETDGEMQENKVVESLRKGKENNARKRKISEKYTETKVEDDGENVETEQVKMNVSDSEDNRDTFKLQISAIDSPDTDDFTPRKEPMKESKRTTQRGKKVLKQDEERNDESKSANKKLTKKGREKKNKVENDGAVNEQKTDENNKDGRRPSQSTRKGRARKSQIARDVDNNVNITEDVVRNEGINEDKNQTNQGTNSAAKLTDGKKGGPKVAANVVQNLNKVEEIGDSSKKVNHKNPAVKSTKAKKRGPRVAENLVEDVDKVQEMDDSSEQGNEKTQQEKCTVKSTKAKKGKPKVATNMVEDVDEVEGRNKTTQRENKGSQQKKSAVKSTKAKNGGSELIQDIAEDVEKALNMDETKIEEPKTQERARKRKSSENLSQNETQQKKGTTKKSRKNTTTEERKTEVDERQPSREATSSSHRDKLESEELELTPKSIPRRSSSKASTPSSSSSKVSRSGRKGKKQEVEDSEGSIDHSSSVKVIFTGLQDALLVKAKKIVQSLGGKVVEQVQECTHLVTDKVRRTVKFLCALSRGVPIVDMSWLDASKKSKSFVDSTKFILIDDDAQMKYDFSMERSLELAKNAGLLSGYKIHVTPHVRPPLDDMKEIIKCAKGEEQDKTKMELPLGMIVSKMPSRDAVDVVVISCDEDKVMCKKAQIQTAYTAELLLTGILRQNLDLEQHKLTLDAIPYVNSTPAKSKGRRKR